MRKTIAQVVLASTTLFMVGCGESDGWQRPPRSSTPNPRNVISTPTPTPVVTRKPIKQITSKPVKQVAQPKKYKNCTELKKDYPSGVSRSSNPAVYELNTARDRDKDGHACE